MDFDPNVDGPVGPRPVFDEDKMVPPADPILRKMEALEVLLANLFVMQKLIAAQVDAMTDILVARGYLTADDLVAINKDVQDAVKDTGIS